MAHWRLERRVKELGYLSYRHYLRSEHWSRVRIRQIKEKGYICELCKSRNKLALHHKTYERLGAELVEDLQWLCRGCHRKVHNIKKRKRKSKSGRRPAK
jgi:5-methylcytosine-specific restriction endonuclease McrA